MSIVVERVTSFSDLRPHRDAWNLLAADTPGAQFFQTFDWFEVYWNHFGAGQQLEVRLVFDAGQLIGIVPLVIRTEQRRIGRVRVLTFPLDDWGSFYAPVTRTPEAVVGAVLDDLAARHKAWDILSWRWLAPDTPSYHAIVQQMQARKLRTFEKPRCTTALVDLPKDWETYLASRSSKFRNNLRRWQKRVEQQGQLRYEKFRPAPDPAGGTDPRWDLYDTCLQLAMQSWQGSSEDGTTLSHESIRPFLRDMHAAAVAVGAADLNLLYLNDQPVVFEYGYVWQGTKFSLRFGYDAQVNRDGIGNLMWLNTIEGSFNAGDHTLDMGPGSLHYKRHYMTRTCDCLTIDYFRPLAPKAQAIHLKNRLQAWWRPPAVQH